MEQTNQNVYQVWGRSSFVGSWLGTGGKIEVDNYLRRPFTNMGTDNPYSLCAVGVNICTFGVTEASSQ